MTYPTTELTWQTSGYNLAVGDSDNVTAHRKWAFSFKNALCTFSLNPWTVLGSCDGTGNASHVGTDDYWTSYNSCTSSSSGNNHSWIVLQSPNGSQICYDMSSGNAWANAGNITFSPTGLYTPALIATGTTTQRPSAPADAVIFVNNDGRSISQFGNGDGNLTGYLHIWHSTDGMHTRIVGCTRAYPVMFGIFDRVQVQTGITWATPNVGAWNARQNTTFVAPTAGLLRDGANLFGYYNSSVINMAAASEFFYNSNVTNLGLMGLTSTWCLAPSTGLWVSTSGLVGKIAVPSASNHSVLPDLLYGSDNIANGSGYLNPVGSTRDWVQLGNLVLPWNNTVIAIT